MYRILWLGPFFHASMLDSLGTLTQPKFPTEKTDLALLNLNQLDVVMYNNFFFTSGGFRDPPLFNDVLSRLELK